MSIDTFLLSSDTTDLNYPEVRPTLDLNFARVKALDPRITFTRASGGSYVGADGLIKFAGVNEARFDHDPYTGESLGLLVEEARTNYLTYSTGTTGWTTGSSSDTIAPDGTATAIRINAIGANLGDSKSFTTVTGSYTGSCYARSRTGVDQSVKIAFSGITGTAQIVPGSGAWVRVQSNAAVSLGAGTRIFNVLAVNDSGIDIDVWGVQAEIGAFPTSYIPTEASTRTRAVDNASITGSNFSSWFNRNNGTLLCNAQNFGTDSNPPLILTATPYYQGPGGYKLGLSGFWSSVTQLSTDAWANGIELGGSQINVSETPAASATIRHSFAYSPTECRACVKQTLGTLGGSQCFQAAQGLDQLSLRQYFFTVSSRISRLAFYPVRLPDAQLQALTR